MKGSDNNTSRSTTLRVVARVRPPSWQEIEADQNTAPCVDVDHEKQSIIVRSRAAAPKTWQKEGQVLQQTFPCEGFHDVTQPEFSNACHITEWLQHAIDGFNCAVIAYGQTGAGKTYTIFGRTPSLEDASAVTKIQRRRSSMDMSMVDHGPLNVLEDFGLAPMAAQQLFTLVRQKLQSERQENDPNNENTGSSTVPSNTVPESPGLSTTTQSPISNSTDENKLKLPSIHAKPIENDSVNVPNTETCPTSKHDNGRYDYLISVSMIEIYKEQLFDLLADAPMQQAEEDALIDALAAEIPDDIGSATPGSSIQNSLWSPGPQTSPTKPTSRKSSLPPRSPRLTSPRRSQLGGGVRASMMSMHGNQSIGQPKRPSDISESTSKYMAFDRDLSNGNGSLSIRFDSKIDSFFVDGARKVRVTSPEAIISLIEHGILRRSTAQHNLNARSSRGHCLLSFHIDAVPRGGSLSSQRNPSQPTSLSPGTRGGKKPRAASGSPRVRNLRTSTRRVRGGSASASISRRQSSIDATKTHGEKASSNDSARSGKLMFVDLAGSENLTISGSEGARRKETGAINKSLFALGHVVDALTKLQRRRQQSAGSPQQTSENESDGGFSPRSNRQSSAFLSRRASSINSSFSSARSSSSSNGYSSGGNTGSMVLPFRNSKLTMLLRDCLGGSAYAMMIACVSPAQQHAVETLQTLRFIVRASQVRNIARINMSPKDEMIARLRAEIRNLRRENDRLRQDHEITNGLGSASSQRSSLHFEQNTPWSENGISTKLIRDTQPDMYRQSHKYSQPNIYAQPISDDMDTNNSPISNSETNQTTQKSARTISNSPPQALFTARPIVHVSNDTMKSTGSKNIAPGTTSDSTTRHESTAMHKQDTIDTSTVPSHTFTHVDSLSQNALSNMESTVIAQTVSQHNVSGPDTFAQRASLQSPQAPSSRRSSHRPHSIRYLRLSNRIAEHGIQANESIRPIQSQQLNRMQVIEPTSNPSHIEKESRHVTDSASSVVEETCVDNHDQGSTTIIAPNGGIREGEEETKFTRTISSNGAIRGENNNFTRTIPSNGSIHEEDQESNVQESTSVSSTNSRINGTDVDSDINDFTVSDSRHIEPDGAINVTSTMHSRVSNVSEESPFIDDTEEALRRNVQTVSTILASSATASTIPTEEKLVSSMNTVNATKSFSFGDTNAVEPLQSEFHENHSNDVETVPSDTHSIASEIEEHVPNKENINEKKQLSLMNQSIAQTSDVYPVQEEIDAHTTPPNFHPIENVHVSQNISTNLPDTKTVHTMPSNHTNLKVLESNARNTEIQSVGDIKTSNSTIPNDQTSHSTENQNYNMGEGNSLRKSTTDAFNQETNRQLKSTYSYEDDWNTDTETKNKLHVNQGENKFVSGNTNDVTDMEHLNRTETKVQLQTATVPHMSEASRATNPDIESSQHTPTIFDNEQHIDITRTIKSRGSDVASTTSSKAPQAPPRPTILSSF